ncbi:MAG: YdiU family protein [Devosiaceae bacterium]|nr:YdiU family protein [Devosiaceae bacterium MH13]
MTRPSTLTEDLPTGARATTAPAWEMSYRSLPQVLHSAVQGYGASAPELLAYNEPLGERLTVPAPLADDQAALAQFFSGNTPLPGHEPLAMAYAGHQFGGFVPRLGDGRAMLLGEAATPDGARFDVQLKGSGTTPYSRRGDGRAALGPVLREYVVAEAMAALGIPTTRALAAVTTGDPVLREGVLPGAILTRVASSHLRVGTFQFAAQCGDEVLEALVDYALQRHPLDTSVDGPPALRLLTAVVDRQADLVAQWMGVGFIHGVMNTDNCTISGETIDYGPCAFMDQYDPAQVFSSIDHMGRYAFSNQPPIAHWNMAVLAQALLPLLDADEERGLQMAQDAVNTFPERFEKAYLRVFCSKLGLPGVGSEDAQLIADFLDLLEAAGADFTTGFRSLANGLESPEPLQTSLGAEAVGWHARWLERLGATEKTALSTKLRAANPTIIPRNHRVEAMIAAAVDGDFSLFHALNAALATPFADPEPGTEAERLAQPPRSDEVVHATFCGT